MAHSLLCLEARCLAITFLTVFCLTAGDGGSVAPWCAPKSVCGAWNSLDTFDWIIFGRAFERTFLVVEPVGCLFRFASQSAVWFIAALVNPSGISDSILHKHKCTFFFPRQAVYMVAVIGTSKARPRGDPENGPESEVGALRVLTRVLSCTSKACTRGNTSRRRQHNLTIYVRPTRVLWLSHP